MNFYNHIPKRALTIMAVVFWLLIIMGINAKYLPTFLDGLFYALTGVLITFLIAYFIMKSHYKVSVSNRYAGVSFLLVWGICGLIHLVAGRDLYGEYGILIPATVSICILMAAFKKFLTAHVSENTIVQNAKYMSDEDYAKSIEDDKP